MYFVFMYENRTIKTVEGRRGGMRDNDGASESNQDVL
jgi:hypothetical protein